MITGLEKHMGESYSAPLMLDTSEQKLCFSCYAPDFCLWVTLEGSYIFLHLLIRLSNILWVEVKASLLWFIILLSGVRVICYLVERKIKTRLQRKLFYLVLLRIKDAKPCTHTFFCFPHMPTELCKAFLLVPVLVKQGHWSVNLKQCSVKWCSFFSYFYIPFFLYRFIAMLGVRGKFKCLVQFTALRSVLVQDGNSSAL